MVQNRTAQSVTYSRGNMIHPLGRCATSGHFLMAGLIKRRNKLKTNIAVGFARKIDTRWMLFIVPFRPVRDQWNYPRKNATTFSDQTGPTKRNGSYHFVFLSQIPYISEIYRREVGE